MIQVFDARWLDCHPERICLGVSGGRPQDVIPSVARDRVGVRSREMFVYILASPSRRLYVGVTNDLVRRVWEHRSGRVPGFAKRYGITRLVYFEPLVGPVQAIEREKQIKDYAQVKKVAMIESMNPEWNDLAECWFADVCPSDSSLRSE
jgi:putative endonuclease